MYNMKLLYKHNNILVVPVNSVNSDFDIDDDSVLQGFYIFKILSKCFIYFSLSL